MAHEPMIRVYRLPDRLTNGFCFGGGNPIPFLNVDWFNAEPPFGVDTTGPTEDELRQFIRSKTYFDPGARFLVLDDRPARTFVIEPGDRPHPHHRRSHPATTAAEDLAELSKELRHMPLSDRAQSLADRLDAAAAKAKSELVNAASQDQADLDGLEAHVASLEDALATPPPTPPTGEQEPA